MTAPIRAPRLPDLGLDRELSARAGGYTCIAGLDEVGRGPLAGPVVSAAVVLDLERVPQGLADSKALTAAQARGSVRRDPGDVACGHRLGVASGDRHHQHPAGLAARHVPGARRASLHAGLAFVDGNDPPRLPCATEAVIKGDSRIASIAAASIVAKVVRDRMMARLGNAYPAYGFASNAGY